MHTVALHLNAFAGQAPADAVQTSARSQSPAAGRQVVPADLKLHVVVQQEPAVPLLAPSSHCSGAVRTPSPHTAMTPTAIDVHPHFEEDFGKASASLLQVFWLFVSQLRHVPTCRIPLPFGSMQVIATAPRS